MEWRLECRYLRHWLLSDYKLNSVCSSMHPRIRGTHISLFSPTEAQAGCKILLHFYYLEIESIVWRMLPSSVLLVNVLSSIIVVYIVFLHFVVHEQDRSTSFYQQPVSCLPSCRRSRLTRAVTQPASGAHVTCTSSLHLFIADFIVNSLLSFLRIQEDFIPLSSASSPAGCGKSLELFF